MLSQAEREQALLCILLETVDVDCVIEVEVEAHIDGEVATMF